MYYDASSTDYISTSSFAIPDTGILTVNAWMKGKHSDTLRNSIMGDGSDSATIGYIYIERYTNDGLLY